MSDQLTVEEALKELRETFLGQRVSITETRRLLAFPDVKLELDEELDYSITVGKGQEAQRFTESTLSDVMAQVRAWHKEQSK